MKEIRIVLVEDEPVTARNLSYILQSLDSKIRIVAMHGSVSDAVGWFIANNDQYDLVFMDVRLSDGVSFDIFKKVQITKAVIFVTAYHDYAIEAFKNNGIDYILKPFNEQEIQRALYKYSSLVRPVDMNDTGSKLAELLKEFNTRVRSYKRSFLVSYRDKLIPLETSKIVWFYTAHELVYAHVNDGRQYILDDTLEQLENQVDPQIFFRANRQFIINRTAITEIEYYFQGRLLVKLDPAPAEKVLISKARASLFKNWLNG
ncbi:MAG TPA: LytTR family DNA-binding domain-containing protein [Niastella sp.]